ncbi:RING-type E3 ubiquitin transferase [Caerostris darwini]|uniref:RING-type E3 ubiquitin transferase n=1 Tax=Caerostris darwini TaxID=1538125 RepID=A0AAV4TRZ0_9ARAC|nr:RING-type E3 ubiquitin transferase [Caerostris darwini]
MLKILDSSRVDHVWIILILISLNLLNLNYEDCKEPVDLSFYQIRHRARKLMNYEDLKVGDKVMVNYNLEEPKERGLWYDCCVINLKNGRSTKQ